MIGPTLSMATARRVYDVLGGRYDWVARHEGRSAGRALELLDVAAGDRAVDLGAGTGRQLAALRRAVRPAGMAVGLDVSPVMLRLARRRAHAPVVQADARALPIRDGAIDRVFAAYLLDLIPLADLPRVMGEIHRVLKPTGRVALVSVTEDRQWPSRVVIGVWKTAYRVSPILCGGCRPVRLAELAFAAGFRQVSREVVSQMGVPSEIIVAVGA